GLCLVHAPGDALSSHIISTLQVAGKKTAAACLFRERHRAQDLRLLHCRGRPASELPPRSLQLRPPSSLIWDRLLALAPDWRRFPSDPVEAKHFIHGLIEFPL